MAQLDKVLYTAHAHTTGGRDGASRTDDGRLDIALSSPGGAGKAPTPSSCLPPATPPASSAP
jgi:organic hydroperoxide reductase OsmC/OhrA